ncbi:2-5A-dependent ribonuclease isoform X2 [Scleropages formosus]|nr:2-5A-dependent ribonuclease-like isoform X2 [Scleropages formosus]
MGNQKEVQNYSDASDELLQNINEYTHGRSFAQWKSKLPAELIQKLEGKKKGYPENTLGLLRFIRNLHEHYPTDAEALDLMATFPDLFSSVYKFAKKMDWNSRPNLRKIFRK